MDAVTGVEGLRDLAWAFRASRVLQLSHKLDLFTLLSQGPLTASEVAEACGSDPDMTGRLLIACCALGLLRFEEGRYGNTKLADEYLVRGRPLYQGNWIAHMDDLWNHWGERLEGELGGRETRERDGHRRFILAMHDMAMAGEAQELVDHLDLEGRRRLLDVGGGPGTYSIFFCRRYPDLTAVVFDLPETIPIAREVVEEFGMKARISLREGDWNRDDFGSGHDVLLMSNILHGPGSQAEMKLGKALDALDQGGLLIIRDFVLNDAKTGPISPALFNLMKGAYSMEEMKGLIKGAGFTNVRVLDIPHGSHAVLLAEKP
jgi:hypothetical protein